MLRNIRFSFMYSWYACLLVVIKTLVFFQSRLRLAGNSSSSFAFLNSKLVAFILNQSHKRQQSHLLHSFKSSLTLYPLISYPRDCFFPFNAFWNTEFPHSWLNSNMHNEISHKEEQRITFLLSVGTSVFLWTPLLPPTRRLDAMSCLYSEALEWGFHLLLRCPTSILYDVLRILILLSDLMWFAVWLIMFHAISSKKERK
jgi:hypothetical protein